MSNKAALVLIRHAFAGSPDAQKFPDDTLRPLKKKKGIRKFKKAAAGLKNLVTPDQVITSPMARTMQTASLLEWDAGWPAATANDALDEGHSPSDVVEMVRKLDGWPCTVALVGHGPNLLELAHYLMLGFGDNANATDFDKGGSMLINTRPKLKAGSGQLGWFYTQKELKNHR